MDNFSFDIDWDWNTTAELSDPRTPRERRYERALALTGFGSGSHEAFYLPEGEFSRPDIMFHALIAKDENRVNPFALPVFDLRPTIEADEPGSWVLSTDTVPSAPSCALVVETLVTGLRTSGAPSATPSAHLGSGAAAA